MKMKIQLAKSKKAGVLEERIYAMQEENVYRGKVTVSKKLKQKFMILLANPDFKREINLTRRAFHIPPTGFAELSQSIHWAKLQDNTLINEYDKRLFKLLKIAQASERWHQIIEFYLLFNRNGTKHLLPPPVEHRIEEQKDGTLKFTIQIFKDTTRKDLDNFWPQIQSYQRILAGPVPNKVGKISDKVVHVLHKRGVVKTSEWKPKRFGTFTEFQDYHKAFILKQNRTQKETAKAMGWKTYEYPKVGTYISKFKKALKENILY